MPDEDYIYEDMLKSIDDILKDVEDVEKLIEEVPDSPEVVFKHDILKKQFDEIDTEKGAPVDGYCDIHIHNNDMVVKADFYPPAKGGKPIEIDDVKTKLENLGIVYGIDWNAINEAIKRCNEYYEQLNDVIIAKGKEPVNEKPSYFVIQPELLQKPKARTEDKKNIDFRDFISYILVKKGQTLATLIPKREGQFGKTVKGLLIPYKKETAPQIKPGENTELVGDKLIATCDGRFHKRGNKIWVSEVFEVEGDVDYSTGNIKFPGDIVIYGQIKDGFRVEAGGSIYCKGTLDASDVLCKGDLIINRGIIGRKQGKILVSGKVSTRFIENCYIEAGESIFVETGILHSLVQTKDRLEMGVRGIIVGGKIIAQNGVSCYQIGTKMGVKTEVYCGIDYSVNQKLEWIREKVSTLAFKMGEISERLKKDPNNSKLIEAKSKVLESIHKLNEAARQFVNILDRNKQAKITVKGPVYPGTYIEICHISFVVPRKIEGIEFYLDKEKEKILTRSIL